MKFVFLLMVIIAVSSPAYSQRLLQVKWPSTNTAPPIVLNQQQREWLPAFRLALGSLPEETVIGLGLMQAQALGVSAIDAARLQSLFANYYARLRQSEAFRTGPSALSYCFSGHQTDEWFGDSLPAGQSYSRHAHHYLFAWLRREPSRLRSLHGGCISKRRDYLSRLRLGACNHSAGLRDGSSKRGRAEYNSQFQAGANRFVRRWSGPVPSLRISSKHL